MAGPLDGYRVLELGEGIATPYAAMELGDAGADVIKVELPAGDRGRGWGSDALGTLGNAYTHLNRNKRGIALDLSTEAGVDVVRRLAAQADVVLHDAAWAGQPAFEYEALRGLNPAMIYVEVSQFGEAGPWAGIPPYGELPAQLSSEITASIGRLGEAPVRMPADLGAMYAAIHAVQAVCAALYCRDETGGQRIDVSLFGSLLAMRSTMWMALSNPDEWSGPHLDSYVKPPDYGYRAKDGYLFVSFARLSREQRDQLYRDLGMDGWVRDEPLFDLVDRDSAAGTGVDAHKVNHIWDRAFANFTRDEVIEIVRRNGGWAFPKHDYESLMAYPQVHHDGIVQDYPSGTGGMTRMQAPPWEFAGTPASVRLPPPSLGEHNAAVLTEVGYTPAQIEALIRDGVLISG
jgi:crotonobetainyl-CoA:carnitine CoA-transferase CaiB-like acyl-CoA transferase